MEVMNENAKREDINRKNNNNNNFFNEKIYPINNPKDLCNILLHEKEEESLICFPSQISVGNICFWCRRIWH